MAKLREQDLMIISEYFLNGFNKTRAFEKYRNNYKTKSSLANASCLFWQREEVKAEVKRLFDFSFGEREEMINELLYQLKERVLEKAIDENYSYSHKQKDIDLLIKISGIDKKPKYDKELNENITFDVILIED